MQLQRIDHVVFTVRDVDATCNYYARALGMEVVVFAGGRKALRFGQCKINLHQYGRRMWVELCSMGIPADESTVRHLVRALRPRRQQAFVPLRFEPGERGEFDFGHAVIWDAGRQIERPFLWADLPETPGTDQ